MKCKQTKQTFQVHLTSSLQSDNIMMNQCTTETCSMSMWAVLVLRGFLKTITKVVLQANGCFSHLSTLIGLHNISKPPSVSSSKSEL